MKIKMHPIVKKYLDNDILLNTLLENYQEDPDPIIQALQQINLAISERGLGSIINKVYRTYRKIDLSNTEAHLALIFIRYFSTILQALGKHKENQALLQFAMSLVSNKIHSELKFSLEHEYSSAFSQRNEHMNKYQKILPKLIHKSIKAKHLFGINIIILARSGLISDNEHDTLSQLKSHRQALTYFYDSIERVDLKKAKEELAKITKLIKQVGYGQFVKYERWVALYQIFTNDFQPITKFDIIDKEHACLLNANYYLLQNQIENTTKWLSKTPIKPDFESSSFLSFTYVRSELAKKNINGSILLLKKKKEIYRHYFDDFFHMRIELLQNDREKALVYFSRLLKNCRYYASENLLELELRLSKEINPADIWYLFNHVDLVTKKDFSIISDTNSNHFIDHKGLDRIIGKSTPMKKIISKIKRFAKANAHILITGETGVGKDVIAHTLHDLSLNAQKPFLAINCGAISESILQSELFGHEAGAYTSADKKHIGIFESAKNGTVFLDEIGDTSPRIQIALLRVLENNEGRPVGATNVVKYSCKIIAATNANLQEKVLKGKFREDLYFRLKSLEIQIPPLRERPEDISTLIHHFFNFDQPKALQPKIADDLMKAFIAYPWPGNVRELKNEVQKIRIMNSEKEYYTIEDTELIKDTVRSKTGNNQNISRKTAQIHEQIISNLTLVRKKNSRNYRIETIKQLFQKYKTLSRQEISDTTHAAYKTIGTDLKGLISEGYIEKVEPTTSPRTHYFQIIE